jgi:hypothetical protein
MAAGATLRKALLGITASLSTLNCSKQHQLSTHLSTEEAALVVEHDVIHGL